MVALVLASVATFRNPPQHKPAATQDHDRNDSLRMDPATHRSHEEADWRRTLANSLTSPQQVITLRYLRIVITRVSC